MKNLIKLSFIGSEVVSNTGSMKITESPTEEELKFLTEFCPDCFVETPKVELKIAAETVVTTPIVQTTAVPTVESTETVTPPPTPPKGK